MTVGTEVVSGVSEIPKPDNIDMTSKVGGDCNGGKPDFVEVNGNGNVQRDLDGSCFLVGDTHEAVSADDMKCDDSCDAELKPLVDSEVGSDLGVQVGEGGVVENGKHIEPLADDEESQCVVLLSGNKDVPLHGKSNGEVVDLVTNGGTVGEAEGSVVEEYENGKVECEVEDGGKTESSPIQDSNANGELTDSLESVSFSPKASYPSDQSVVSAEISNVHPALELGEMQESIIVSVTSQSSEESDLELEQISEPVTKSPSASDSSVESAQLAEQGNVDSEADLGETEASLNVVLQASELPQVVIGEDNLHEQLTVEEDNTDYGFKTAISVDSGCHQLQLAKNEDSVEKVDADVHNTDVADKLANEADPLEDKAQIEEGVYDLINGTSQNSSILPSPVSMISQNEIDIVPLECSEIQDDVRGVEQELSTSVNSQVSSQPFPAHEVDVANLVNGTCAPLDANITFSSEADIIEVPLSEHGDGSQEKGANLVKAEVSRSVTYDHDDENEIADVPVKSLGRCLESPDVPASDQGVVDNIVNGLAEGGEAEQVVLTTETITDPVSDENTILDHIVPVDKNRDAPEVIKEKTGELPVESDGSINDTKVETELESCSGTESQKEVNNGLNGTGYPDNIVSFETKITFGSFGPSSIVFTSRCDNVLTEFQVSKGETECSRTQNTSNHIYPQIQNRGGVKSDSDSQSSSLKSSLDTSPKALTIPTDAPDKCVSGVDAGTKPFQFLIKVPRFDDDPKHQEKLGDAQLLVAEKTSQRDAIQKEIQREKAILKTLNRNCEAAISRAGSTRSIIQRKKQEIDHLQDLMDTVRNASSITDIDAKIYAMEHKIEHETLPLKEEKRLIREIQQQKKLRDERLSYMGTQDEIEQALDQREQIEGRLKILWKELDGLKDELSQAESAVTLSIKDCDAKIAKLNELRDLCGKAHGVRDEAYNNFKKLKDKSNCFWIYRKQAYEARKYAERGYRDALSRLCSNQVETLMELWNKDDEFRKDYIRCNMRSTLRRLKTLDGRSLGPDEEPPVLPINVNERVHSHLADPYKAISSKLVSTLEQETPVPAVTVKRQITDGESFEMEEPKNQMLKGNITVKRMTVSGPEVASSPETDVKENLQTKEELELAAKAEKSRKQEIDAKLKEQHRLEEKAKAQEALQRKKRKAEKAQIRAELRAQKEAEQKEKEREKRLRKKEKKKSTVAADDHNIAVDAETAAALQLQNIETSKQSESKESPTTVARPQKTANHAKQSKTKAIPPPLRNRGKRRLKDMWGWIIVVAIILFIALLIFGGEGGAFGSSKSQQR